MKKTLFMAVLAGTMLAGCVKNEEAVKSDSSPARITFDAPVVSVPTRADEISNSYPTNKDFGVYARCHVGDFTDFNATTSYMDNVQCTYKGHTITVPSGETAPSDYWAPAQAYYWPKTENSKLTFGAYAPSSNATEWPSAQVAWDENGFKFTDFKVNDTPTSQIDLLYSARIFNKTKANNQTDVNPTNYDGIQIPFKHALSSIVFTARALNANTVKLKSIKVKNIYSKGTFNQGLTHSSTGDTESAGWSNYSEPQEYAIYTASAGDNSALTADVNNPKTFNSTGAATGGVRKSDLIVLPQNLDKTGRATGYALNTGETEKQDAIVTVTYQIYNGSAWSEDQESTFGLATGSAANPVYTWDMGKRYTYNISIGLYEIYFAPTVENWNPEDGLLTDI